MCDEKVNASRVPRYEPNNEMKNEECLEIEKRKFGGVFKWYRRNLFYWNVGYDPNNITGLSLWVIINQKRAWERYDSRNH